MYQVKAAEAGTAGNSRTARLAFSLKTLPCAPLVALALLGAGPQAAWAQAAPPPAPPPGAVAPPTREELLPPQIREDRRPSTLTVDGSLERAPCALDNPQFADLRVTLSAVSFSGAEQATDVDLATAYQAYLGRDLPLSVLCDIRAAATTMLNDAGYLAAVEIPEQRLDGGAVQFRVVLGRLTALRVRGDAGPSERLLARYLQPLVDQPVFNTRRAERVLLLANDMPGLDVRLSLRSASQGQPGELIGEVAVVRRRAVVDLNIQNYSSPQLGRFGGLLRAQLFDLTGMGDVTTVSGYTSHDFDEQQTLQLGHEFLVGTQGLRLGGQVTFGWTNPTLGIAGFDVTSDTIFATVHAAYPLVRSQVQTLTGGAGVDLVDQDVRANGFLLTRDRVRTGWLRLDAQTMDRDSVARRLGYSPYEPRQRLQLGAELRQGLGIFGANFDCRPSATACANANLLPTRVEQDPRPLLLRIEAQAEYRPLPYVTLATRSQVQFTRDALPAFEEMTGGNYSIGRGYYPGSVTGDNGIAGSAELRLGSLIPRTIDGWAWQPYAFLDAARLTDRDPSQRALNPDRLASLGGGIRVAWGRGLQADLAVAVPLVRTDANRLAGLPREHARILFSLSSRLAPWRF